MKYRVEYLVDNREQAKGYQPHNDISEVMDDDIEAESEQEAIIFAMDHIVEWISPDSFTAEIDDNNLRINVYDEAGELYEQYYRFIAKKVK
ncbi:hypothetical protein [Christensenella timonensis]|uniref:hypothetical protein n=1 Tax=Christensenella timonensis TaxID=1816678 RepID=UPI0008333EBF|nr:hypothetical protein [Christensenella timonensis]